MITEDYVSFETAKLLKEKGFNVYGDGSYDSGIEIYKEYSPFGKLNSCTTSKPHREAYAAPTLQMAMKWLRETHNLVVSVEPEVNTDSELDLFYVFKIFEIKDTLTQLIYNRYELCDSYEQACEESIKYCIENLI